MGYKDKLNDEIKPEIGRQLAENLRNAGNPAEQATTLSAIGNSKEREPLVKVLGENLKTYPQNEQVLRELLRTNPDNSVKKEIYKYIVPK